MTKLETLNLMDKTDNWYIIATTQHEIALVYDALFDLEKSDCETYILVETDRGHQTGVGIVKMDNSIVDLLYNELSKLHSNLTNLTDIFFNHAKT